MHVRLLQLIRPGLSNQARIYVPRVTLSPGLIPRPVLYALQSGFLCLECSLQSIPVSLTERLIPHWLQRSLSEARLVEEQLNGSYPFYKNNKAIRQEIEQLEKKLRSRSLFAGEGAMEQFYTARLSEISSIHDLNRLIKEKGNDKFLFMKKEDILVTEIPESAADFPDKVIIGDKKFALKYAFEPGNEIDGVTLRIPLCDAPYIPKSSLGYLVPALWSSKILELLRNLPKEIRKKLMPLNDKAEELSKAISVSAEPFENTLSEAIKIYMESALTPGF